MKELFQTYRPGRDRAQIISRAEDVLQSYQRQGYKLSLRQLYYQLVAKNHIENSDRSYKILSETIMRARNGGLIDWDSIEDRTRGIRQPAKVDGFSQALTKTMMNYRLDRMKGQDYYLEVWIEKDAVSNIVYRVTQKYGIPLMANKGYSSASAMYEAQQRFKNKLSDNPAENRTSKVLYLGDHDPSGMDMFRDITQRNRLFNGYTFFERLGLNMDQIEDLKPPENPAKLKDTRAKEYIKEFGRSSWELDALTPNYLETLLENAILQHIDIGKYNGVLEEEKQDKARMSEIIKKNEEEAL